ncbi:MAG TPA: alpha-glucosidase C-terminal domain-containing protein, partial [Candidatus Limiplasma sp.]|nr:alpha-glucosidase C-terminal domain-containing protein [Candidatus Limiplasma sp.]
RKTYDIVTDGRYRLLDEANPHVYTYVREADGETLLVLCNFSMNPQSAGHIQALVDQSDCTLLLGNYDAEQSVTDSLRPYEARVYLLR